MISMFFTLNRSLTSAKSRATKEVPLQRRIFSLLFLIAGVPLFQSVQAQTDVFDGPPLVQADGTGINGPAAVSGPTPGTYNISRDLLNAASGALNAERGGTITGIPGSVTL